MTPDQWLSVAIGLIVGMVTCLMSWWVLYHVIVPKVAFSEQLSRLPAPEQPTGFEHRFRFSNPGRRGLIDLQVSARVSILGLQFPNLWTVYRLPLDRTGELTYQIPLVSPNNDRTICVYPSFSKEIRESAVLPPEIREKASKGLLHLEDLLALGQKASMTAYVIGYDEFSGSRRLFKSKHYRLGDVADGIFRGLEVLPPDSPSNAGA